MNVGDRYRLKEKWITLAKGTKVRLMAKIEYNTKFTGTTSKVFGAVIEVPWSGTSWKFSTQENYNIIEQSEDLDDETLINHIPLSYLEPIDNDNIILWNLANKWSVIRTDSWNRWKKERFEKYGI